MVLPSSRRAALSANARAGAWPSAGVRATAAAGGGGQASDEIGGQREVAGLLLAEYLADDPVDLPGRVDLVQARRGAGDLPGRAEEVPVVAVEQAVVDRKPAALDVQARGPGDVQHRHVLGVGAGDAVHGRQLAHAVGRDDDPEAVDSRVAVGHVGRVELVRVADPPKAGMSLDLVEEGEVVVAGKAEDMAHAGRGDAVEQVTADAGRLVVRHDDPAAGWLIAVTNIRNFGNMLILHLIFKQVIRI